MADERLCNPISTQSWSAAGQAARAAMPEQKLDALIVQGANNMCGTGGYFRWFTGVSMGDLVSGDGDFSQGRADDAGQPRPDGRRARFRRQGSGLARRRQWLPTASFPAIDYCIPYDPELVAREIKKAGYRNVGIVGWNNMLFGFGDTLRKLLDGVTLSDATRLIDPLKAHKSAEEIELIRMAGQMQDEILAKVQSQIKAGKKDFELIAYGAYVGNLLGSETGYMLGSSAPPGQPTQIAAAASRAARCTTATSSITSARTPGPAA